MAELNKRLSSQTSILRIKTEVNIDGYAPDLVQIEHTLDTLAAHFKRFMESHMALVGAAQTEELKTHDALLAKVELAYNEVVVKLQRLRVCAKEQVKLPSVHGMSELKLDPIKLPTFDGRPENWLAFKDMFESLVHNRAEFDPIYKLSRLRQCVREDAVPMVGGVYTGGYDQLWKELKRRYDNPRRLVEAHVYRLLDLPDHPGESQCAIRNVIDVVRGTLRALTVMGLPTDQWDAIVFPIVLRKLPAAAVAHWTVKSNGDQLPELQTMLVDIETYADTVRDESAAPPRRHAPQRTAKSHVVTAPVTHTAAKSSTACPQCTEPHRLYKCPQFRTLTIEQRMNLVRGASLCFNCLSAGHTARACTAGLCHLCKQRHNTLLCRTNSTPGRALASSAATPSSPSPLLPAAVTSWRPAQAPRVLPGVDAVQSFLAQTEDVVLLATANAYVLDGCGEQRKCRLLCDMGSQVSFVTESFFNSLNLPRRRKTLTVEGIGAQGAMASRGLTSLTLRSTQDTGFEFCVDAHILPTITTTIPASQINISGYAHLRELPLADPTFHMPGRIDMLLGADIWGMLLLGGVITGAPHHPSALHTHLGWVICGPASSQRVVLSAVCSVPQEHDEEQRLDTILQRFWELEEVASHPGNDSVCEEIFRQTVSRNPGGRYVVQIPFRPDAPALGDSYHIALRQFCQLERRQHKDTELWSQYVEFMREYERLGHMEVVTNPGRHHEDGSQSYYIPHHAVTAKFRVVFNASAQTSNGISLNDVQLVGPQLQEPLVNILLRFRRFRVTITADVEKMFRQVQVDPRHRQWQRILWRETPDDPLLIYQLTTVTYGMACSPFNAIRALQQCAIDNQTVVADAKRAASACYSILNNFYVDDYLDSADTSEQAITLARDISAILQEGGFRLRKWNSNCIDALATITGSRSAATELRVGDASATILGLHWEPDHDELLFKVTTYGNDDIPTKRIVLRAIARIFDPLGLLSPVTVTAKIFMQATWAAKIDWDTPLPANLREEWLKFHCALPGLRALRIPRWLGMTSTAAISLHGFCDASSKAYAAVVYARSRADDGKIRVTLVTARTKVAPIKSVTIPRLELCAAHLLVSCMVNVREALQLREVTSTYWSDSSIVLSWIQKPPSTLMQYVSNRVAYIQMNSDIRCWRHIRSQDNPADCASRGLSPAVIGSFSLWWTGPRGLLEDYDRSSSSPMVEASEQLAHDVELRPQRTYLCVLPVPQLQIHVYDNSKPTVIPLVERFSTLQRVLHTTAYVLRFRPSGRPNWGNPVITATEVQQALLLHIREAQGKFYRTEINQLRNSCSVGSSSPLLQLYPFLDDTGILRVGGRLQHADLTYNQRHPFILPKHCPLAALLVNNAHRVTLHGGIRAMLQFLRQKVWIVHCRSLVKTFIHRCKPCKLHQRAMQQQQMAALPRSRVHVAPPFTNTGLDYAGPFNVRCGGRRSTTTTKTYAAIFICMCTKAVHIELAENLSTSAFLDVFDRFVSRRGYCTNLYSDNGTQFVGADRQLKADLVEWKSAHVKQQVADVGVNWKFITPAAPHHGGLWEAAVRSAKKHLRRVVGTQSLTFQHLSTLLVRIEACLNSRPIVAIHDDTEGGTALSPGDFLIGRPLNSRPEADPPEVPENRLRYHQRLQRMYLHFWRRWQEEYLTQLQARAKWARPVPNLQVGDVVAIQHEHLPPSRWRIGRIVEVHPGSDSLVRVVTIEYCTERHTPAGLFLTHQCRRPVQRVCRIIEAGEEVLSPSAPAGEDVRD